MSSSNAGLRSPQDGALCGPTDLEAIIVGGGVSGIASAVRFQLDLQLNRYLIFEQSDDLGGTWHLNTYPGAGCDIPTRLYSFSFAQRDNWDIFFSLQPEIKDYLQDVTNRYRLLSRTKLRTTVLSAQWIPERSHWAVRARDSQGQETVYTARAIVSCIGLLSIPRECDVHGWKTFGGELFHSAQWRNDVQLKGKKVVILGNGCSATQIVPTIAPEVEKVTQIVRAKHWIAPQYIHPTGAPIFKWIQRNLAGFAALERWVIALVIETHFLQAFKHDGVAARERFANVCRKYVKECAPPEYHHLLLPDPEKVPVACKRRIFDNGYIPSLGRSNVELTNDQAKEIVSDGVILQSGRKLEADVIVLANGFRTDGVQSFDVINGNGVTLSQYWKEHGGVPSAYRGVMVANFPSFFLIWGPNTNTGHFSAIWAIERAVELMTSVLRPVFEAPSETRDAKATNGPLQRSFGRSVEVKRSAEELEQTFVQRSMDDLIFTAGCGAWYQDPETGKVVNAAPSFQMTYARRCAFPSFSDYRYKGISSDRAWRAWHVHQRIGSLLRLGATPDKRTNEEARRGLLARLWRLVLLPPRAIAAFIAIWLLRGTSRLTDALLRWNYPPKYRGPGPRIAIN
ncbi:FAD/NAD(P)-binding domain-containing protein [Ceraceosorus guamensis]|uniref:FAD/NAD(P)-binding domain-containing protein n=1 Tax=Ceraceosorus guamensis TaxID=1522189 RepID=A0A316W7N2_9BASI|nr:FAD/NAD(P)-binding domain-containing protein [Ceraceosorus guamensis]PWN45832.1 FAD/NAD(P)-binding domain-containing protein [Ceraceosorus guamensis]